MARQDRKGRTDAPSRHSGVPSPAPPAKKGDYTIGIRRIGELVEITLAAGSEYAAMELYDSLVQSAERGYLRLELKLPRS